MATKVNPNWHPDTLAVRAGHQRSPWGETSEALYLTSGFCYPDAETAEARFKGENEGFVYSRYGNPTIETFHQRMIALEPGAEACTATASGMSAVFGALASYLNSGDHVVASKALFGSCWQILANILPRWGIESTLVDGGDLTAWEAAFRPNTRAVFLETPSNPLLTLVDIEAVAKLAHANRQDCLVVVDNVFATPLAQHPLSLGADVTVYSATKHIDGQGRVLGGAILGSEHHREEVLLPFMRHTGPSLSAFNAWLLVKGLETLSLRVERSTASALHLAQVLEQHPKIKRVAYPWLPSHPQHDLARKQMAHGSTLVAFELDGGQKEAFDFMRRLELIDVSNNLGDSKSLITHPGTTTHRAMDEDMRNELGINERLVRLSVGLENASDLETDLLAALDG